MKNESTTRRRFLQLAAAGTVVAATSAAADDASDTSEARIEDAVLTVEFDATLRLRLSYRGRILGPWSVSDVLLLASGERLERFAVQRHQVNAFNDAQGAGRRLTISGSCDAQVEKTVDVSLFDRYPGFAFYQARFRNLADRPVRIKGWASGGVRIAHDASSAGVDAGHTPFWAFCGSTHQDRRDWVQPVRSGFRQENFMGMSASDYGGGIPIADVWRRDVGVAVGHLENKPKLVSLPVACDATGVELSMHMTRRPWSLAGGETLSTLQGFVAVHTGDHFAVLDTYRRVMAERGVSFTTPPPAAYESIWCAWGYERECSVELIEKTLPKVRDLGLKWAVVDDGWQSNIGDWGLNAAKFPGGEADMKRLVRSIDSHALKARLWFAPLAAAPGSDLLHDHSDMLLLDKNGAPQLVSWWNSFYLCPAHPATVAFTTALVRRFVADWGYAGLKIDGQHLNGVAPCFNPAHHHARPEESVEKLPEFLQAIYQAAIDANRNAVVEVCPCGTGYSPFNFPAMNQAPASDPENSWQVRHKGKTLKALMGPHAAFAGDHVELSDGGNDFASTVGIGAIVSTKFTWPVDPKPKDSFLLTPQRESLWRKWIGLYNRNMLPLGVYRGDLYDIGFDQPEGHVIVKGERLYFAFYGTDFHGLVPLRGLSAGRYRLRDYFNDRDLGEVSSSSNRLRLDFEHFMVIEATPV
jgi:alpha-galactosidase